MVSVANKPTMLSAIMLNVVMLSVAAPNFLSLFQNGKFLSFLRKNKIIFDKTGIFLYTTTTGI